MVDTSGYNVNFSLRNIEFVGFPATTYYALTSSTSLTAVQSNTLQSQPGHLEHNCGLWSKLLEATIPADSADGPYYNTMLEGYIHYPGTTADYTAPVTLGQLAFEAVFPDNGGTDARVRGIEVPLTNAGAGSPYPDGNYQFGDIGFFAEANTETIRLWARKVNTSCNPALNGQQGAFNVSDRYFWVRHIPSAGACLFH